MSKSGETPGSIAPSGSGETRGSERREQILAVALDLFTHCGMANVSTRRIAQAVGISQPSLYAHFASADDIATELCTRGFERLHTMSAEVLKAPGTPAERFERLGRAYIDFALAHPDIYRIAFMVEHNKDISQAEHDIKFNEGLQVYGVLRSVVAEVLNGESDLVDIHAQSCWASVHGLVSLLLARDHFPWSEREALICGHLANIRRGIIG